MLNRYSVYWIAQEIKKDNEGELVLYDDVKHLEEYNKKLLSLLIAKTICATDNIFIKLNIPIMDEQGQIRDLNNIANDLLIALKVKPPTE